MLATVLPVAFCLLSLASLLCLFRLLRGPSLPDRVLALDTLCINAIALITLYGVSGGHTLHFEAALLIALIGFISTVAMARYCARGSVIEP